MSPAALLGGALLLRGTVDQIDAGIAAVEQSDLEIVYVPIDLLPEHTREGDRVVLRARRTPLKTRRNRRHHHRRPLVARRER